ncbi:MAG: TauD/TfdA family dioxygenase [Pseudomonadota bacterium]|nr:TauD/TfdA family dioxygenase [Pseudomonadota bacterium]
MTVALLDAPFGARVQQLDLRRHVDDDLIEELADLLYRHRILVIEGQQLDQAQYYNFGRQWGTLIRHVLDYLRMPDYPEMMAIGNTEGKDRNPATRNGAVHWHTDGSYKVEPTTLTMLYARLVPEVGGETLFNDMVAAYAALEPERQRLADSRTVQHFFGAAKLAAGELPVTPIKTDVQAKAVPPVTKPLVMHHPVTGHRALYGLGQSPFRVNQLPQIEGDAYLAQLKAHATQPQFVYRHHYSVGDIVMFDCLSTMHSSTQMDFTESPDAVDARLLWRLSTEGFPDPISRRLS